MFVGDGAGGAGKVGPEECWGGGRPEGEDMVYPGDGRGCCPVGADGQFGVRSGEGAAGVVPSRQCGPAL